MKPFILPLLTAALVAGSAGYAQTVEDIDQRRAALLEAWDKTPLTVRRAIFVSGDPEGFGMYEARNSNVFKPGEPLMVYAEPAGYGWKDIGNALFEFGFTVDFAVKSPDRKILAGQQDFAKLVRQSHVRNLEFMLSLTLNLTGAPAGDYVLEYTLRDVTGAKSTKFELPFKIS